MVPVLPEQAEEQRHRGRMVRILRKLETSPRFDNIPASGNIPGIGRGVRYFTAGTPDRRGPQKIAGALPGLLSRRVADGGEQM